MMIIINDHRRNGDDGPLCWTINHHSSRLMLAGVHLNENFPSTKVPRHPKRQISAGKAVSKAPHSSFLTRGSPDTTSDPALPSLSPGGAAPEAPGATQSYLGSI